MRPVCSSEAWKRSPLSEPTSAPLTSPASDSADTDTRRSPEEEVEDEEVEDDEEDSKRSSVRWWGLCSVDASHSQTRPSVEAVTSDDTSEPDASTSACRLHRERERERWRG